MLAGWIVEESRSREEKGREVKVDLLRSGLRMSFLDDMIEVSRQFTGERVNYERGC